MENEKVNILVLEDEGIVALGLEDTLHSGGYHVAGMADNGGEALDIIKKYPVDLALLDIHIKGEWDGVETAKKITQIKDIPFIYLTAFSDHETVSRARDTTPAAYLVKPYQAHNLLIAIDLAMHNFDLRKTAPDNDLPVSPRDKSPFIDQKDDLLVFNHSVFIKQNFKYLKIIPDEIKYLEVTGNHTWIVTAAKKYIVRYALQSILEKLNLNTFVRVHRSFAINLRQLSSFDTTSVFLGDSEIPISRSYKDEFFERLTIL